MANRLSKITKPAKKQKPVPVRIVYDEPKGLSTNAVSLRGIDKYEAQEALRTLQRAAEIQNNKPLMKAAKTEAANMMKQLSSVCGVKK